MFAFLKTNNLLSNHRYGFRQARSTGDLAYAVYAWSSALESYGESRVISLDISKAFDRIWNKGFLLNCQSLVFTTPSLHGYLAFYLIGQLQLGSMATSLNPHSINSGVPQGSAISPVLFILSINDLLSSTSSSIFSFADDTYLSSSFPSTPQHYGYSNISPYRNTSASLLTNDLANVENLGNENLVKFNQEKTTQVVISRKHHQDFPLFS